MRTIRIYQPGYYECGQTMTLSEEAGQHVGVVLRMQPGELLTLFGGDNREFLATIVNSHKRKVTVHLDSVTTVNRESPRNIHLAQAISKGERMEWVIQKAVELGVTSITPLVSAHCVVRLDADRLAKKQLQWQAIAISASEQSGRNQIPKIHSTTTLETYVQNCNAHYRWVLYPEATKSWRDYAQIPGDISLLIGPEGGLSEDEVKEAFRNDFQPLSLGPRILRTETAAIAAVCLLQAIYGDL